MKNQILSTQNRGSFHSVPYQLLKFQQFFIANTSPVAIFEIRVWTIDSSSCSIDDGTLTLPPEIPVRGSLPHRRLVEKSGWRISWWVHRSFFGIQEPVSHAAMLMPPFLCLEPVPSYWVVYSFPFKRGKEDDAIITWINLWIKTCRVSYTVSPKEDPERLAGNSPYPIHHYNDRHLTWSDLITYTTKTTGPFSAVQVT